MNILTKQNNQKTKHQISQFSTISILDVNKLFAGKKSRFHCFTYPLLETDD